MADLSGANLEAANLQRAYLEKTDLRGANLQQAKLERASLRGADLRGANLRHAFLNGVALQRAVVDVADLEGAHIEGTYLDQQHFLLGSIKTLYQWLGHFLGLSARSTQPETLEPQTEKLRVEKFRIFLEADSLNNATEVFESARAFYEQLGFSINEESEWRRGSLLKDATALPKGSINQDKIQRRASIAENVLLGRRDRETTVELAKAAVDLENAFEGKQGAITIDLGLFNFLRRASEDGHNDTFFKRLAVEERSLLDSDPTLLSDPERLFATIKDMRVLAASKIAVLKDKAAS